MFSGQKKSVSAHWVLFQKNEERFALNYMCETVSSSLPCSLVWINSTSPSIKPSLTFQV